jgi:hypothetical protein
MCWRLVAEGKDRRSAGGIVEVEEVEERVEGGRGGGWVGSLGLGLGALGA